MKKKHNLSGSIVGPISYCGYCMYVNLNCQCTDLLTTDSHHWLAHECRNDNDLTETVRCFILFPSVLFVRCLVVSSTMLKEESRDQLSAK